MNASVDLTVKCTAADYDDGVNLRKHVSSIKLFLLLLLITDWQH